MKKALTARIRVSLVFLIHYVCRLSQPFLIISMGSSWCIRYDVFLLFCSLWGGLCQIPLLVPKDVVASDRSPF